MAYTENVFCIGLFILVLYVTGVLIVNSQRALITTMPDKLQALSGSCVQIPCAFEIPTIHSNDFNKSTNISGVWLKGATTFGTTPEIKIFNSSKTDSKFQGQIIGNLFQKNCTTVFYNVKNSYTDKYFFRIDANGPYRATDTYKQIEIFVQDVPPIPTMTDSVEVKEGTLVSLNCSAVAPCPEHPPNLTWTFPTKSTPEDHLQENPDQTKSVVSMVTFTSSYLHNEKNITCTAVYPVGTSYKTAEINRTLNVLFSPKDTSASISPSVPVSVGSCVNLTCSSTANPPVTNYTWFRISEGKPTQVSFRQNYTLNVIVEDGGLYYCEAVNDVGLGNSSEVLLAIKAQDKPVSPLVYGIVGGISVIMLIVILIAFFGWKRKSRFPDQHERTDNPLEQNPSVYNNQGMVKSKPEEQAEDQSEEIHYGEIIFSKQRPKETPAVAKDRDQVQESEYSEVKVTRR
ncbi:hypothetical protein UPYG_G00071460 [Umbra pygmaea]|uniref:Ig-like domain-containing protein n=1 Tax=Umbra pygmaea TaxID=75934 RepID=A0ABD0XBX4_UMBPY